MRKLSLFLALAMILAITSGALAQDLGYVSISNITNMYGAGLRAGNSHEVSITYDFRSMSQRPPSYIVGSNGFEIYSPEGAQWTSMVGSINTPLSNQLAASVSKLKKHVYFDGTNWNPVPTNAGAGPVGPSGGINTRAGYWYAIADLNGEDGWEGGADNGVALTMTFSTLMADVGKTMCIDSSDIGNSVAWEWALPDPYPPIWDNDGATAGNQAGPRCLEILAVPNEVPVWCAPPGLNDSKTFNHCAEASYDLCATDPDQSGPVTYKFVTGFEHGTIVGNHWSWSGLGIPQSGFVDVKFLASDGIGDSQAEFTLHLTFENTAPTITAPTAVVTVGLTKCDSIKFTAADADLCDNVTVTALPAGAIIRGSYIVYCPTVEGTADFVLTASDGLLTAETTVHFKAIKGAPYQVELEKKQDQVQGVFTDVFIKLYGVDQNGIGGFDFLVAYDASALSFQLAYEGQIYNQDDAALPGCGWEYFTYRFGAYGNCGNACPSGLVRVIGLAETNNGPNHPDCQDTPYYDPAGMPMILAQLRFLVSNDRTLECSFVPIRFYWIECGDNAISSADGSLLLLSSAVYDFTNYGSAFIGTSIDNGTIGYPTYQGAQNECICTPNSDPTCKKAAIRAVDFQNGGVDIVCADSIDARGDINLNGLGYEIADAVMFTNYFIEGIGAFGTHVQGSIAASDTNADGLALTVADLVYLIRVVVGDAQPYDKAIPVAANVTVDNGLVSVDAPMGAAHIVVAGEVTPTLLATNMEMKYGVVDGNTNIIVYSLEANQSFTGQFLNAEGRVISANLATFLGQPVSATVMPANFALHQNYPNPFNPTTTIKIDVPKVGVEWNLSIYNVTGQLVQTMSGTSTGFDEVVWDASNNASGIYFYKLTAGDFSATKKAVLLK